MLVVDEAGMADTRTLAPLLEEAALAVAERGQGAWAAGTSDKLALQTATEDGVSLSEEQARMVRGVCTSRDRVVCVVGLAGRGRRPRPVRQGKLLANPASRADLPPAHDFAGKEISRDHSDAIRAALLDLVPLDPLRNEPDLFSVCLFDVALGTGLRLGELRALRWRDTD